jgi:predicted RNase H-like HicB family nuclease
MDDVEGTAPVQYAVVIEKGQRNYSACVPDLPGCVATGETLEEVRQEIRAAVDFHIAGLKEDGCPMPEPTSVCDYVETAAQS